MSTRRLSRLIACVALLAAIGAGYGVTGSAPQASDARTAIRPIGIPDAPAAHQALQRHRARFEPWLLASPGISGIERAGDWLRPVRIGAQGRVAERTVDLLLPERADRPFRLGDPASGVSVEVTLLGLGASAAEVADGYVVYRRAHAGAGDLLQRPTAAGTEDYLIFEAPPERAGVSYSISLTEGVAGLRLVANTLEFLDASGNPRLRMSPPFILDRDGAVHAASVAVAGCATDANPLPPWGRPVTAPGASRCTVDVTWAAKGIVYPAVLDPSWTAVSNTMSESRMNHSATLLNAALDQNHIAKVLIAGGRTASGTRTNTVDIYNPITNAFSPTAPMACARELHTATLLGDGRVLVVGGLTSGDGIAGGAADAACPTAEVYNPSTGTWAPQTLATALPIWGHAASRIEAGAQAGKVLITGGRTAPAGKPTSGAYIFNPQTGTMQKIPSMPGSRYRHGQASESAGGLVIVGGGKCSDCTSLNTSFEADTNKADATKINWTSAATTSNTEEGPVLVRVFGNKALIAGGGNAGSATSDSQLHTFGGQGWKDKRQMSTPRKQHRGAVMSDGRVIVAGGMDAAGNVLASAEIWDGSTNTWSSDPNAIVPMTHPRAAHTLTGMQLGKVLVTGGFGPGGAVSNDAEVFPIAVAPPLCNPPCGAGSECLEPNVCAPTQCAPATADCDANPANGCETPTDTQANCGACGNACSANGACAASGDSYACQCSPGYAGNGNTCDDINECAVNNGGCSPNATCTNTPGSFVCSCNTGYSGNGFSCDDVDECATNTHNCGPNTLCSNLPGSFSCSCNAGFDDCDGNPANGCETPLDTLANCGVCGNACVRDNASASCATGTCVLAACNAGFDNCDGNPANGCESPLDTLTNCGACGSGCAFANADASCAAGTCQLAACDTEFGNCDNNPANGCESPLDTLTNCGACFSACGFHNASASCTTGTCELGACTTGFGNCDNNPANGCESPLDTLTNCGACFSACGFDNASASCATGACVIAACTTGFDNCDGNPANGCETTIFTDTNHCGGCGNLCSFANASAACSAGSCALGPCTAGFDNCDGNPANGCETNLNTTTDHCGGCGNICSFANASATCSAGSCALGLCAAGFDNCDANPANGCETNLVTDITHCGGCGNLCSFANASATCSVGICGIGVCTGGFDDCDGHAANGCETNLIADANHCGGCGIVCPTPANATSICVSTECGSSCNVGFGDCNGVAFDGCETDTSTNPNNCGGCGNVCGANSTCTAGTCVVACDAGLTDCGGTCVDLSSDSLNCGACGNDCDSGLTACEHRACNFGTCGAQFDTARCLAPIGDTTSAGSCAFARENCAGHIDSDLDGLSDTWEDAGAIDVNCDGTLDANDVTVPNANKFVKDVYVSIAYMAGSPHTYSAADTNTPLCPTTQYTEPPEGHRPQQDSIDFVVRAFAGAHLTPAAQPCGKSGDSVCPAGYSCVDFACLPDCTSDAECLQSCNNDCSAMGGANCVPKDEGGGNVCRLWRLHVDPLPTAGVEHHDIVSFGDLDPLCTNTTGGGSMTPGDQANYFDYKSANFDPRAGAFKHFLLFAHDNTCYGNGCGSCPPILGQPAQPGTSGISEIKGNDSIVSLGLLQIQNTPSERISAEAGSLIHELGHNLGLNHGGPVGVPANIRKVNYLSSMNFLYQLDGIPFTDFPGSNLQVGSRPDFSHTPLSMPLDERNLSEPDGVGYPGLAEPNALALIKYIHRRPLFNPSPRCDCPINLCTGSKPAFCAALASGALMPDGTVPPIDWDCDGVPNDVGVSVDLNGNGQTQEVHDPTGTADWINLFYEFQCETTYADLTSGQLASGVQERQYRELGFDLRPPLIARLDVQPLCVDVAGGGAIPATIFGSATLDVSMIDLSAMRLGAASMSPVSVRTGDFDGDGWQDLKADFLQGPLTIAGTDFWLHATGTLLNGRTFNARDVIEPDHQSRDCDTRGSMPMTDEEVDASGR